MSLSFLINFGKTNVTPCPYKGNNFFSLILSQFLTGTDFSAGFYMYFISSAKILFKSSITSKMSKDKMRRIEMLVSNKGIKAL